MYNKVFGKILVHMMFTGHWTEHIPDPKVQDQEHI